jgi:hypothetical protein
MPWQTLAGVCFALLSTSPHFLMDLMDLMDLMEVMEVMEVSRDSLNH